MCSTHVDILCQGSSKGWVIVAKAGLVLVGALETATKIWRGGAGMAKKTQGDLQGDPLCS